jgi:hypothetical protein
MHMMRVFVPSQNRLVPVSFNRRIEHASFLFRNNQNQDIVCNESLTESPFVFSIPTAAMSSSLWARAAHRQQLLEQYSYLEAAAVQAALDYNAAAAAVAAAAAAAAAAVAAADSSNQSSSFFSFMSSERGTVEHKKKDDFFKKERKELQEQITLSDIQMERCAKLMEEFSEPKASGTQAFCFDLLVRVFYLWLFL